MPHATTQTINHVLVVTFDRDDKLNAISPEMTAALWEAVRAARDDDEVRVLVIRANGRYFSAGIDLNSSTGGGGEIDPADPNRGALFRKTLRQHHLLYDEFEALEKPIVVAMQGPCLGAGLEMAVSCDFRLASEDAAFALPEIKLGVTSASGGISRLTRLVGPGWARWLAMAGRRVDAKTALTMGLVQDVLPADGFHSAVHQFALDLVALPREALGLSKVTIDACLSADRATARDIDRIAATTLIFREEFQQQVAGFRAGSTRP